MPANRPALGAVLRRPDVQRRRAEIREHGRLARLEHRARQDALARLLTAADATRNGQRLDIIARDLRGLADDLEQLPGRLLDAAS